jgi:hypothetical protein
LIIAKLAPSGMQFLCVKPTAEPIINLDSTGKYLEVVQNSGTAAFMER